MKVSLGLFGAIVLFFVAAWIATKWPQVNLIGKFTGG